jgi:hemerythrin-like domain-containing protein
MNSTRNLLEEHLIIRRVGNIVQKCSDRLYADDDIPIEGIEILSVVIEEFIDAFHHCKEEKAYFPATKSKDGYSEDIRKFLVEHELGRRIATILRRGIEGLKSFSQTNAMLSATESKRKRGCSLVPQVLCSHY